MTDSSKHNTTNTGGILSSVFKFMHFSANWRWKYLLWLFLMYLNEYTMEFSRLLPKDKESIIQGFITENNGDKEVEAARYEAEQQLAGITSFLKKNERSVDNKILIQQQIANLSEFIDSKQGKGYKTAIAEIRRIEWFQWDLYFISDSFLFLILFMMLSYDGNRYYYFGDLTVPFMFGLTRYAFKASVLWALVDFLSNIFTRSERILNNEILITVIALYLLFIVVAIWEDVKKELQCKRNKQQLNT